MFFRSAIVVLAVVSSFLTAHAAPGRPAKSASAGSPVASAPAASAPAASAPAASVPAASAPAASVPAASAPAASAPAASAPASAGKVPQPPPVPIITNGAEIAAELLVETSVVDRFKKLLTDSNGVLLTGDALRQLTVFDFNQQTKSTSGPGGSILLANGDIFPILTDLSVSGAVSFVAPCGLNIPHFHPRGNEFFTLVEGVLDTSMLVENGFTQVVKTQLGKYQATVFPRGSMHFQQNPTCDPAVFVAGFDTTDAGRSDLLNNLLQFDSDVIEAALGFPDTVDATNINAWRAHLPINLAAGVDSCLKACGLTAEE